jgi:citrate lyase subunit beta/citryl-CoA lyase
VTDALFRPRRSVLFLPATNARAMEKAKGLPCDVVILDLEDAVAPDLKDQARDAAVQAIREGGFGRRELAVRINGLDTPWAEADLKALSAAGPDAVLVPKIADAGDVARYDSRLSHAPDKTQLWVMIETARAIFHLESIAASSKNTRLGAMVIGPNDLAKETGAQLGGGREPLWAAMSMTVAAARIYGVTALDGVYNNFKDDEGFAREAALARAFGFHGKTLIHPNQVEPCNRAFAPSDEEVEWARKVIAAFAGEGSETLGALQVDGQMVERLHLVQAERLLAGIGG